MKKALKPYFMFLYKFEHEFSVFNVLMRVNTKYLQISKKNFSTKSRNVPKVSFLKFILNKNYSLVSQL